MNILITGGSGYLGGCIYNYFRKRKEFKITICSSSNVRKIEGFDFVPINWDKKESIKNVCKNQDIIIHCASPDARECEKNPDNSNKFNSITLDFFIKTAISSLVKKFIFFSTAHVYRSPLKGIIDEKTPLKPSHPYGISKKIGEQTLLKYKDVENFELNVIRLSNAFGVPCSKSKKPWDLVVNDFCKQAVVNNTININSDGKQLRNFVSVKEVCRLLNFMINLFFKSKKLPIIFNFGGNWTLSIKDLAELVANRYEKRYGIKPKTIIKKKLHKKDDLFFSFNYDLIIEQGFKPKNNNLNDVDELFKFVKAKFINAK